MTDRELMQLLRAFHEIEVEEIEADLARKRASCLSLIRARALVLNPRLWTKVEREHVAGCDSCSRLAERLERGVLHPSLWTLVRWSGGVLVDGEARTIQDHLEKDECQRCCRLLESAWLRALVELVKAGHANLKEAHGLTDAVVSPLAPLPAPIGAFAATTRSPFLLEAGQAESAFSAALRETDDGELMLHIKTPDPALAGRTVHVEILGESEPLTATVPLKAEVGDGCSGQQTFGRFDEVAAQLGKDCVCLAVLTGDNGSSPARTADPLAESEGRRRSKMSDWIYCATAGQVNAAHTQSLLQTHQAIWCPPPGLHPWPGTPVPGDRLWLVWRAQAGGDPTFLLGGGRIEQAPRNLFNTNLLWADPDMRGVRAAGQQLGYTGPMNMCFLRLQGAVFPLAEGNPQAPGLGALEAGLNVATAQQAQVLNGLLAIP
jgi:hypothetical protein